jgi:hypothetical protein
MGSKDGMKSQILVVIQRTSIEGSEGLVEEAQMKRWDVGY